MYTFVLLFVLAYTGIYVFQREFCPENFHDNRGGKYTIQELSKIIAEIEKATGIKPIKLNRVKKNGPEFTLSFLGTKNHIVRDYNISLNKGKLTYLKQ